MRVNRNIVHTVCSYLFLHLIQVVWLYEKKKTFIQHDLWNVSSIVQSTAESKCQKAPMRAVFAIILFVLCVKRFRNRPLIHDFLRTHSCRDRFVCAFQFLVFIIDFLKRNTRLANVLKWYYNTSRIRERREIRFVASGMEYRLSHFRFRRRHALSLCSRFIIRECS